MWRIRTTDDAGRPTRLQRFGVMPWRPSQRARRHWLGALILSPAGLMTALFLTVIGGIVAIALVSGPWILGVLIFSPAAAIFATLATGTAKSWNALAVSRATRIKRSYLRQRACPACAYTLAGLDPDPAGLVRCPECGGTWLRDPPKPPVRVLIRNDASADPHPI